MEFVTLENGRNLCFDEIGSPNGRPIFLFHGIPGSRFQRPVSDDLLKKFDIRLITFDRPGYGKSDPVPKRSLLDWPHDIEQVLDSMKISRFSVAGVSGGGPYALACAKSLPNRVRQVVLLESLCPVEDLPSYYPIKNFFLSHGYYKGLLRILIRRWMRSLKNPTTKSGGPFSGLMLSRSDRQVLFKQNFLQQVRLDFLEGFRQGPEALLQDLELLSRPWGFDLKEIKQPIQIWHGTSDYIVPPIASRILNSQLSTSRLYLSKGDGHYSLPLKRLKTFLKFLVCD